MINEKIREYREKCGMTQEELAKQLYTSKSFVNQMEQGTVKIPLIRAIQIADIFECTLDELLGRTKNA